MYIANIDCLLQANGHLGRFYILAIVKYCDEDECKISIWVPTFSYFFI